MVDMLSMLKKAQDLQEKMQQEISQLQATGTAGAGLVTIQLSGTGNITSIKIDESLLKSEESDILEDLIIAAHNEAKNKLEAAIAKKTQDLTAGLPLPSGFNLPF